MNWITRRIPRAASVTQGRARSRCALRTWRIALACAGCLGLVHASAGRARATEGDVQAAARAFQAGQEAQLGGDHERAARMFELAHAIAPTPQALRSALRAHLAAEHAARAATLALEAQMLYPDDDDSTALADQVLAQLEPDLALIAVRCSEACSLLVDERAASLRSSLTMGVYVEPGAHVLRASFGERGQVTRELNLIAGERVEVALTAPPRPVADLRPARAGELARAHMHERAHEERAPRPSASSGLPPWTFWTAVSVTAGTGLVGAISAIDAADHERRYQQEPTRDRYEAGVDAARRTELLLGITGVLAVGTGVLALFTDFDGEQAPVPDLAFGRDGASMTWRRHFP